MSQPRQRGLTLIELLIAITLLGITLTLAYAALRTGLRSDERVAQLVAEQEDQRAVEGFLRRHLRGIRALRGAENDNGDRPLLFRASAQGLDYVAPVPAQQPQLAGLQAFSLWVEEEELRLRLSPLADYASDGGRHRLLLEDLEEARFSYYGKPGRQREFGWHDHWRDDEEMPRLLRLVWRDIEGRERQWLFDIAAQGEQQ